MDASIETISYFYPSRCYTCEHARKLGSDKRMKQGYIGCTMLVWDTHRDITEDKCPICGRPPETKSESIFSYVGEAEVVAEGWVDLRCRPKLGKGAGVLTNYQLVTKGVRECSAYRSER